MKTKQQAIQEAYGEHWETVKEYVDDNGWCELNVSQKEPINNFAHHGKTEWKPINNKVCWRPKSLKGIEDYNIFYDVIGFEDYKVNKFGCVISKSRVSVRKNGKKYTVSEKIMKPQTDSHGYIVFCFRKDNRPNKVYLHRILAELFIPNNENKLCVNHKNGVKNDNSLSNLEWATYSENNKHAFNTGLQKSGEEHHLFGKRGSKCHNYRKNNKKVLHNDIVYDCVEDLANKLNLTVGYLYQCLSGSCKNTLNIQYV